MRNRWTRAVHPTIDDAPRRPYLAYGLSIWMRIAVEGILNVTLGRGWRIGESTEER